jgi:hypothetical protein
MLSRQFLGQLRRAFAGPAQGGHGVAARGGIDQPLQGFPQARIGLRQRPTPATRRSHACRSDHPTLRRKLQLLQSSHDRGAREAGGSSHQRNPAPAGIPRFRSRPLPPPPLVQFDRDQPKLVANPCLDFGILHAQVIAASAASTNTNLSKLFFRPALVAAGAWACGWTSDSAIAVSL